MRTLRARSHLRLLPRSGPRHQIRTRGSLRRRPDDRRRARRQRHRYGVRARSAVTQSSWNVLRSAPSGSPCAAALGEVGATAWPSPGGGLLEQQGPPASAKSGPDRLPERDAARARGEIGARRAKVFTASERQDRLVELALRLEQPRLVPLPAEKQLGRASVFGRDDGARSSCSASCRRPPARRGRPVAEGSRTRARIVRRFGRSECLTQDARARERVAQPHIQPATLTRRRPCRARPEAPALRRRGGRCRAPRRAGRHRPGAAQGCRGPPPVVCRPSLQLRDRAVARRQSVPARRGGCRDR